ncbi:MAG: hypothetical protein ACKVVT_17770 [Dehalococcoidia bacterium]
MTPTASADAATRADHAGGAEIGMDHHFSLMSMYLDRLRLLDHGWQADLDTPPTTEAVRWRAAYLLASLRRRGQPTGEAVIVPIYDGELELEWLEPDKDRDLVVEIRNDGRFRVLLHSSGSFQTSESTSIEQAQALIESWFLSAQAA